ncbi:membrane integrity-associated transporter subunit PqiC [bacterium]|nr:membrane integrity-associated transporter subunit PqiC [bacterium]
MRKFICGLFLVLCACSFRSPDPTFYMMNSNGLSAVSERKINVAVARVKVPDLLDRAQMVAYEKDSDEVQIQEFNRWGESFPDMMQATITNDLMAYLPNAFIKRTYFDSGNMSYSVNVEINNLKAYKGDKVILSAWWNISNSGGRVLKREQVSYEVPVQGNNIQDVVNAQSEAVHKMSRDIAEALVKL